jgi:hypothetical protein
VRKIRLSSARREIRLVRDSAVRLGALIKEGLGQLRGGMLTTRDDPVTSRTNAMRVGRRKRFLVFGGPEADAPQPTKKAAALQMEDSRNSFATDSDFRDSALERRNFDADQPHAEIRIN